MSNLRKLSGLELLALHITKPSMGKAIDAEKDRRSLTTAKPSSRKAA